MASATPGDQNRARARNRHRTDEYEHEYEHEYEYEYGKKGDKSYMLQGQKWPIQ
jgi:hypothetical protein